MLFSLAKTTIPLSLHSFSLAITLLFSSLPLSWRSAGKNYLGLRLRGDSTNPFPFSRFFSLFSRYVYLYPGTRLSISACRAPASTPPLALSSSAGLFLSRSSSLLLLPCLATWSTTLLSYLFAPLSLPLHLSHPSRLPKPPALPLHPVPKPLVTSPDFCFKVVTTFLAQSIPTLDPCRTGMTTAVSPPGGEVRWRRIS